MRVDFATACVSTPVHELLKVVHSCAVDVWQCVYLSTHYTSITTHSAAIERKHTVCVCVCVVLVIIKTYWRFW